MRCLDAAGLSRYQVDVGHSEFFQGLLAGLRLDAAVEASVKAALAGRDFVALEKLLAGTAVGRAERRLLLRFPALRGGPEILDAVNGPAAAATDNLRACVAEVEKQGLADRVIVDLSLVRDLGYYTGAVFEVLDPAVGFAIGGGGRYDDLLGRFGLPLPACGIALDIHRVHLAQLDEGRLS